MFKADIITFLGTKMPRVELPLENKVKQIHHQGSEKSQRSLITAQVIDICGYRVQFFVFKVLIYVC